MSASKPSGVASEELTEQREATLPDVRAEPRTPLAREHESGTVSPETPQTQGASRASGTALGAGPEELAAGQPGSARVEGAANVTREALAADDLTTTQTAPPRRLGEYELLDKLGEGGMGAVYRARHTKLKRLEAVKILPSRRLEDPHAVARFEREMEAVGRLNHPHIVQAHDAREIDGTHFLVMEYVEGIDLQDLVRRCGRLRVADACELVRQAAVGLQYAHEHGLVHRDIKPSNLMLQCSPLSPKADIAAPDASPATADPAGHHAADPTARVPDAATPQPAGFGETRLHSEPTVKILDLGLALLTVGQAGAAEMTGTGQAMGTADYMAPEQVTDSHHVDIRADLYSLGCTLYKLLTGHAPFAGPEYGGGYQKMTAHIHEPIQPLRAHRDDIPEELERVLQRLVAKRPADRFATPGELATALTPFVAGANLRRLAAQARGEMLPHSVVGFLRNPTRVSERRGHVGRSLRDRLLTGRNVAIALLFFAFLALSIIFTLRDGQQTVKVEIDGAVLSDAAVTVWLDGRELEIKGVGETIKLKPGPHGYEIRRGDQIIKTREFTVVKGDNPVLKISVEGTPVAAKPAGTPPTAAASPGAVNYELAFDGATSYVTTPVKYDGSHPLTLEAWVTIADVGHYHHLIQNYDADKGFALEVTPERRWCVTTRLNLKDFAQKRSKYPVPLGRHHVAMVFDAKQASLFVDGLQVDVEQFSDAEKYRPSSEPFTLGAFREAASQLTCAFSGNIDEVRISRVARYHTDFTPQDRFEPDKGILALYHFDEAQGDIAHDASGNGHDAKIVNAEWVEVGDKRPLPGVIARPARIPGLGRWQVATSRTEEVTSLAWSPNGTVIACGTMAGSVRIYDARTLALVRLLPGHKGRVHCVAWSPDGTWLAATWEARMLGLWKADGSPGPVFPVSSAQLRLAWSPDGKQIASVGYYGPPVNLWPVDGTKGPVFEGHTGNVYGVAWRPDGKVIASAGSDRTVRLWGVDGKAGPILKGHVDEVVSVAWSPDGTQVASGDERGEIRLWNVATDSSRVLKGHTGEVYSLAWSPDGKTLLSGSSDGSVRMWPVASESDPVAISPGTSAVNCVAWSPDGGQFASAGQNGVVRLWRNDGTPERLLDGKWREVTAMDWSRSADRIALSSQEGTVRIWRPDGTPERMLRTDAVQVLSIAYSSDGQRLAASDREDSVSVWKDDGGFVQTLKGHQSNVCALAWHPDGQRLASASWDQSIRLWQTDGKPGPVLKGSGVRALAWHPDGTQLASAGDDGTLRFWQPDGTPGTVVDTHVWLHSIAWSPNGEWLATGGGRVTLWRRDGKPGPELKDQPNGGMAVAWSPDGQLLASGGYENTVRLWRLDGTLRGVLRGHTGAVHALTWVGDGKLVSGDAGGVVRMWKVETGTAEWTAICLKDNRHVTFSPTGEILHGHPKVIEEELIYLVEKPDGSTELLKPSEFNKRAGR